ncbi:MAG: hypothetical protein AVDCRST_MAG48-528, partial [uncultured Friedmanniella sp.]
DHRRPPARLGPRPAAVPLARPAARADLPDGRRGRGAAPSPRLRRRRGRAGAGAADPADTAL